MKSETSSVDSNFEEQVVVVYKCDCFSYLYYICCYKPCND